MGVGLGPKEQLIEDLQALIQQTKSRMMENQNLLKQHEDEVKHLQQRSVNVNTQLKRIEDNFDTCPREDIRTAYEEAMETKTRLISMRGQLEQTQSTQDHLMELSDTVTDLLDRVQNVSLEGGSGPAKPVNHTLSLAGEQIVRIIEAGEAERQRLATALHDGPTTSLSNFVLQTDICKRAIGRNPERANEELDTLKIQATATFQRMRGFIFDLRPMMLDDLGLVATMRRYSENVSDSGAHADFRLTGAERRLPKHVEVIMFRGLQLLIANARDHLGAKAINISLDISDNMVRGVVEDTDGRGFNPSVALNPDSGDSPLGNLAELQERVELVGGTLDVYSSEGEGSRIEISLPFSDK